MPVNNNGSPNFHHRNFQMGVNFFFHMALAFFGSASVHNESNNPAWVTRKGEETPTMTYQVWCSGGDGLKSF